MFQALWTGARRHALHCAALGALVLVGRLIVWPGWPIAALLLACLVIVPLGLALAAPEEAGGWRRGCWTVAVWLQLPAALCVVGGTFLPTGVVAVLLVLPWLFVTCCVALAGTLRQWNRRRLMSEAATDAGMIYLAVGGLWTVLAFWGQDIWEWILPLSRSGAWGRETALLLVRLLGFPPLIVQLTAVHFHFAGFVLPLLAGQVARVRPGVEATVAGLGVILGVPLVAVGINLTQLGEPGFEPWAAWFLSAAGVLTAVLHLWHAGSLPALPRLLLTVSGVSLLLAMAFSSLYAWGRFSGLEIIGIDRMLPTHGAINALGFALPGLLGWLLCRPGGSP